MSIWYRFENVITAKNQTNIFNMKMQRLTDEYEEGLVTWGNTENLKTVKIQLSIDVGKRHNCGKSEGETAFILHTYMC